tara:strand:- start:10363 stop:12936 length:2574 start_codon:yes stop_codon:yes gene_type:complete
MTNNTNKGSLKFLVGVPVLLLIASLFFNNEGEEKKALINDINPYINPISNSYLEALSNASKNDTTFFHTLIDDYAIRELVIFKALPTSFEVKQDFTVEVYPTNIALQKEHGDFITLNLVRDAVVFNSNNKAYCMFKMSLPIIDINKLVVKQNGKPTDNRSWAITIESPFDNLTIKAEQVIKDINYNSEPYQPNPYSLLFTEELKANNIGVLKGYYSKRNDTLFKTKRDINLYCNSNGKTIGKVNQRRVFWKRINTKDQTFIKEIKFNGSSSDEARLLLSDFIDKKLTFDKVFNVEKLALFNALENVFVDICRSKEFYFMYNSEENMLEPFYFDSNCKLAAQKYVRKSNIENIMYLEELVKALEKVSKINFYNKHINDNQLLKNELALINSFQPKTLFNYDVIKANQKAIKKSLNPSSALKVELISKDSKRMTVSAKNLTNYSIEVLGLNHLDKTEIISLNPVKQILSGQKDTLTINLPRSFENLFVSKKKKIVGFVLPKHIPELSIQYRIIGLDRASGAPIIPYQKKGKVEDDLFRTASVINNHKSINVDEVKKEISFSKDSVVISSPLVVDKGYTFKLNPGTVVNIIDDGKIISHSPLNFIGTRNKPITVYSLDDKGEGLLVLSRHKKSILKHVVFDNLRNPTQGNWGVTGSVTFYESPVELQYVAIKNNKCEDALNIVRTNFTMNQVAISNTQSDAFDGDFVNGSILNCQFYNLGNDAIDVSGSDLLIRNVTIANAGDKGVSAGENSKIKINGVEISDSAIAVAGKDLSIVYAKKLKISRTKLGFTAFQKKPEFGPSEINVNGISMSDIETNYLIESSSSLFIDNKKIETTQNVKDRMYGVEFGRSSAETRNTPQ